MEQQKQIAEATVEHIGLIKWVLGGMATTAMGAYGWMLHKINRVEDSKVSKDAFEEFKKGNEEAHHYTHNTLKEIKKEIFNGRH